jgi:hypothetical protein
LASIHLDLIEAASCLIPAIVTLAEAALPDTRMPDLPQFEPPRHPELVKHPALDAFLAALTAISQPPRTVQHTLVPA